MIGGDADRLDVADAQFAGDDGGRHQAAAGDRDDRRPAAKRIANAEYYDRALADIPEIRLPPRPAGHRRVYHLYVVFAEDRDGLLAHLQGQGIEAKIHYPVPLYLQEGLKYLGYKPGAFPTTDRHTLDIITFPTDQHLSRDEQDQVIAAVRAYYGRG